MYIGSCHTGEIEIPDHPLVRQTIRDCLESAMDATGRRSRPPGVVYARMSRAEIDEAIERMNRVMNA